MNFIFYDSNGTITRSGMVSENGRNLIDVLPGETILEVSEPLGDTERYKVVDGAVVSKSDSELQTIDDADLAKLIKKDRDNELFLTDWTQLPGGPLTDSKKAEWATYRQTLRDLPTNSNWPNLQEGDWPAEPS